MLEFCQAIKKGISPTHFLSGIHSIKFLAIKYSFYQGNFSGQFEIASQNRLCRVLYPLLVKRAISWLSACPKQRRHFHLGGFWTFWHNIMFTLLHFEIILKFSDLKNLSWAGALYDPQTRPRDCAFQLQCFVFVIFKLLSYFRCSSFWTTLPFHFLSPFVLSSQPLRYFNRIYLKSVFCFAHF